MIYFKFPFDENFYSTDEKSAAETVSFYSFDQLQKISFKGKITVLDKDHFTDENFQSDVLVNDLTQAVPEDKNEYIHKLNKVIDVIKKNNLPKLVLSRRKIVRIFKIDIKESFLHLCESYPNAFRYIFIKDDNAWMGAFSEVLGKFNKKTHEFETMSLAGTIPVAEEWTEKEVEEQKPVTSYIRNILDKYGIADSVYESATYDHVSGNIKHLRTDFKIKIHPENLDSIIGELHPTPAVCGIPKDFCREFIDETEQFPRELYAGFIKTETQDYIQYYVNLRCARLYRHSVHLFVGGGITAQSDPEKEWAETELKSEAVLKNLVIC